MMAMREDLHGAREASGAPMRRGLSSFVFLLPPQRSGLFVVGICRANQMASETDVGRFAGMKT